jgi:hypothetical protein
MDMKKYNLSKKDKVYNWYKAITSDIDKVSFDAQYVFLKGGLDTNLFCELVNMHTGIRETTIGVYLREFKRDGLK